jgi:hypothetical protein
VIEASGKRPAQSPAPVATGLERRGLRRDGLLATEPATPAFEPVASCVPVHRVNDWEYEFRMGVPGR